MGKRHSKSNRAWSFGFGVCFSIIAMIGFFSSDGISGCAGDCFTCHAQLINDKDHQSLKTCITCHTPNKIKFKLEVTALDGCGDRCFVCHNEFPKDAYHAPLTTCLTCHEK